MRLWEVKSGKLLKTWDFPTSIKRVEFSADGSLLLGVTESRSGHLGTICVYEINPDPEAEQSDEQVLKITCEDSKPTVAGFSYLAHYIISGHADGSVSQWDAKEGQLLYNTQVHEPDAESTFFLKHFEPCLTFRSQGSPVGAGSHILHHRFKGQDGQGMCPLSARGNLC
jgi:WD40 repeat protein